MQVILLALCSAIFGTTCILSGCCCVTRQQSGRTLRSKVTTDCADPGRPSRAHTGSQGGEPAFNTPAPEKSHGGVATHYGADWCVDGVGQQRSQFRDVGTKITGASREEAIK